MIVIKDVCFGYEEIEVLHNINLTVQEGSFAVVVGPNGGGKSTLLRLVLGLLKPRYGTISVMGKTPEAAREHISYVPQCLQYDELFPVSVLDITLMGLVGRHLFGGYSRQDRKLAESALDEVGLAAMINRPFAELSGGERQRVLIAQALTSAPRLMLLDEPGANLDPENRLRLYELLAKLNSRMTILMVSHNLNVIASHASHVICVNRTADMHLIGEISGAALENGAWTHLIHNSDCPVSMNEQNSLSTPHCALHNKD